MKNRPRLNQNLNLLFGFPTALKKAFADEQSIQEMAKDFIMLNLLVSEHRPLLFGVSVSFNKHFSATKGGDTGPEFGP